MERAHIAVLVCTAVLLTYAFVLWARALWDVLKRPSSHWDGVGYSKATWVLLLVFGGLLGVWLYGRGPRTLLRRYENAAEATFDPTAFGVPAGGLQCRGGEFKPPIQA